MQADFRRQLTAAFALGCLTFAFPPAAAFAQQAQARLTTTVPAGLHKTLRLRNVPAETQIALAIKASGKVLVSLLTDADAARYPDVAEPVFSAPVDRAMSFSVTVPQSGTYYVVFDNTRGDGPSTVQLVLRAARRQGAEPGPKPSTPPGAIPPEDRPSPLLRKPGMHDM